VTVATSAGADKAPFGGLAAANTHTCAHPLGGQTGARCWGTEDKGALGNGTPASETSAAAVPVNIMSEVKQVVAGGGHTCALDANGDGRCWGDNTLGQLGVAPVGGMLDAPGGKVGTLPLAFIAAGAATTCGISVMNRTLACVGSNSSGQLGRGGTKDTSAHPDPMPVQDPSGVGTNFDGVIVVSVGRDHVCAIKGSNLQVFCWGEGADGQLGDSFGGQARTLPVPVGEAE
jgi:alpha-tubulin suppressor-like RCC1 family protein